jgi:hypothetical protein
MIMLTLRIHKVRDRHRVDAIGLGNVGAEDGISSGFRARSQVLLANSLDMLLDAVCSLQITVSRSFQPGGVSDLKHEAAHIETYQLLSKRVLLELQLVHASLGGAEQSGGGKECALHYG